MVISLMTGSQNQGQRTYVRSSNRERIVNKLLHPPSPA